TTAAGGVVFRGGRVGLSARRGYGRLIIGRWVHIGDGNAIRAHEGTLRIGDKCVFGKDNTVNCYLDVEFGAATIVADWVYICDFDHLFADIHVPIKDQGIVKSPVRIGPDVWLGTKVTVLRGVTVGRGCVVAANAVVNRDLPAYSVAVVVPARVVRNRVEGYGKAAARGAAVADTARKPAAAAEAAQCGATQAAAAAHTDALQAAARARGTQVGGVRQGSAGVEAARADAGQVDAVRVGGAQHGFA